MGDGRWRARRRRGGRRSRHPGPGSPQSLASRCQAITRIECPTAMAAFFLPMRQASQAVVRRQVGVAAAGSGPGALGQLPASGCPWSPDAARRGAGCCWTAPSPRGQVPAVGEHRHVDADLGDDRLRRLAHPGDGIELVPGPAKGAITWSTSVSMRRWRPPGAQGGQGPDAPAGRDGRNRPRSAWRSCGSLVRSGHGPARPAPGSRSPATRAASIARPETPSTSAATESSLMPASSRVFWMRWHSALWVWISRLR